MRVVMVSKACVVGIYQRKLEEIARLGVDLTVVVPPGWRDERGWLPLERTHTEGYRLLVTPMALNGSFHLHHYPRLGSVLDQVQPDLIHIDEEPYNVATWRAAHLVWRTATPYAGRASPRLVFFTWQNLHRRYPPPFSWMERAVYKRAAYAIAGNHAAAQVLRAKGYAGPLCVIPQFGVDPALYRAGQPPAEGEPFVIGYVGRLVPEKGVDDLIKAASRLAGDWRVRLLGAGPQHEALRYLAQSLGIAGRILFEGQMPSSDVPARLSEMHALVLPSRTRRNWMEQFGRALVEGMASGIPVVGSDSGEIPNVIGDAGLIFPEGDVEALRRHLQSMIDDPNLWAGLARRGRERVMAHFTQAQIAAETVQVYREALA